MVSFAAPSTVTLTVYIIVFATPPNRGFATRGVPMMFGVTAKAGCESRPTPMAKPQAERDERVARRLECMEDLMGWGAKPPTR